MNNLVDERGINLHAHEDFEGMRAAGRLTAGTLDMITAHVHEGTTTADLDRVCHEFIFDHGAIPASLGYRGYTHATCISLNHVVCHGVPGGRVLVEGDILNIDLAVILDGWHGDSSRMYIVGKIGIRATRLIEVAYEAMMRGIAAVRPEATLGDVGFSVQGYVEAAQFSVVRDFCGHGLGRVYHGAPDVLNYGQEGEGLRLRPGMFLAVEPMVNPGRFEVKVLSDGWTAVARDRSLSAQFEQSVGATESGCEIFTLSPAGLDKPV